MIKTAVNWRPNGQASQRDYLTLAVRTRPQIESFLPQLYLDSVPLSIAYHNIIPPYRRIKMAMRTLTSTASLVRCSIPRKTTRSSVRRSRALGDSGEDRPKLTRENEPEEYWVSEREKAGKSTFSDPLAIIGVVSILFPLILLLVLSALGVVDLTPH